MYPLPCLSIPPFFCDSSIYLENHSPCAGKSRRDADTESKNRNDVYRQFARKHTELYRIIMGVHALDIPLLESAAEKIAKPILRVISDYGIEGDLQIHYQRLLRSVMHGFFAHENSGGFSVSDIDKDTSYRFSIECIAAQIEYPSARTRCARHAFSTVGIPPIVIVHST